MAMKRISVGATGTVDAVSIAQAKPGRVVVKLVLIRDEGLVERLASLADCQLPVAVTLDSLQGEMSVEPEEDVREGHPLGQRLRSDVAEAVGD